MSDASSSIHINGPVATLRISAELFAALGTRVIRKEAHAALDALIDEIQADYGQYGGLLNGVEDRGAIVKIEIGTP